MKPRVVIAVAVLVTASLVAGNSLAAFAADDYPSWADVEAAMHDEKAKKAEITKIQGIIAGLEATNSDLAKGALVQNELYNQAHDKLVAAKAKAAALTAQADAASTAAQTSHRQVGALVAQLVRGGSSNVTLDVLLHADNADDYLYGLGQLDALTARTQQVYAQARIDENTATALADQAAVATTALAKISTTAQSAKDKATSDSAAATASLAAQKAKSQQLYDQLASLKGTTSATEKAYQAGLAWEKAQQAVKHPPAPPPGPPVNPPPAAPSGDAVSSAIAFAQAQVGDGYSLGGEGPDVWDCSGLTKAAYASVGVYIGTHSATNQYATMAAAGRLLPIASLQAGDLLFYSNGGSTTGTKYHTALYIGGGKMIEAPYPGVSVRVAAIRYGDLVPYAGRPTP